MKAWYLTNDEGRITTTTTDEQFSEGMNELDFPDDFNFSHQGDYLVQDGNLVYDGAQTKEEEETAAAAESAKKIFEETNAFFAPGGGKDQMQQEIDDAASGGADQQLQALARMQVMTMNLTDVPSSDVVQFCNYWPEWKPNTKYKFQQPLTWKGKYYRTSKELTSQETYPPDTAGESEYYPIEIAPDGTIVYRTCHGSYDAVQEGETRHYPNADSPVYRAKVDTAYDPDTVPANWELVPDAT